MITVYIRTLIVYIFLLFAMRILGKRQLGELEVSELITTILLSEIASMPISNLDIPISFAIIPLIIIVTLEVTISLISSRFTSTKRIFSPTPSTLIYKGIINQKELRKNRVSPEELISELRLKGISSPNEVEYAILEQNGMLSIIPKMQNQPLTLEHLKDKKYTNGIAHIIISQGVWNDYNINLLHLDKQQIEKFLSKKRISSDEIFLLTIDDSGQKSLTLKEK